MYYYPTLHSMHESMVIQPRAASQGARMGSVMTSKMRMEGRRRAFTFSFLPSCSRAHHVTRNEREIQKTRNHSMGQLGDTMGDLEAVTDPIFPPHRAT